MSTKRRKKVQKKLRICWLYPDLMSTYGDHGNVVALQKRAQWRGIKATVAYHTVGSSTALLEKADIFLMGGAQDTQQEIVSRDLLGKKKAELSRKINTGTPGLFVCGAYQLLGAYYIDAAKKKIPGLAIIDCYTIHTGDQKQRLTGNVKALWKGVEIVGFENHGGRTYLGSSAVSFATIVKGHGNNGSDGTEGVLHKNAIGTYLHGPLLPKNPEVADWILQKTLLVKYGETSALAPLNDTLEHTARSTLLRRL